jgi:membrane-associated phospholipid phosphatase
MGVELPWLTEVSQLLNNEFIFVILILGIVLIAEQRNEKRVKIIVALVIAAMMGLALKNIYRIDRICSNELNCPVDYAFPSGHSIAAFTIMIAFLDKKHYPLFLAFGFFVSFTRLHLGVHTFEDVAAALPIAILAYHIVDSKLKGGKE